MAKKKKSAEKKARVHKDLEGFEIKVNPLGEITSNYNIDQINKFLDKNVYDKKLTKKDEEDEQYPIEDSSDTEENEDDFLKGSDEDDEEDLPPKSRGGK